VLLYSCDGRLLPASNRVADAGSRLADGRGELRRKDLSIRGPGITSALPAQLDQPCVLPSTFQRNQKSALRIVMLTHEMNDVHRRVTR
jgi:hypothetical protein